MITDPRTTPETARGRRIYAVAIGLLGALLIAPMQTRVLGEGGAARVADDRLRRAAAHHPRPGGARAARAAPGRAASPPALAGSASSPCRRGGVRRAHRRRRQPGPLGRRASPAAALASDVSRHDRAHAERRLDHAADSDGRSQATRRRPGLVERARQARRDQAAARERAYLAALKAQIARPSAGRSSSRATTSRGRPAAAAGRRSGAADGRRDAHGQVTPLTYPAARRPQSGAATSFKHVFDLALTNGRFLIIGEGATHRAAGGARAAAPRTRPSRRASAPSRSSGS